MANREQRGNKETRKPKQEKPKGTPLKAPGAAGPAKLAPGKDEKKK